MGFAQKKSSKPDAQQKQRDNEVLQQKSDQKSTEGEASIMRATSENESPIQPKLTVGKPGDQYEREADETADRVMSAPAKGASSINGVNQSIQKKDFLQTILFDEKSGTSNDVINKKEEEVISKKEFLQAESEPVDLSPKEEVVSKKEFLQTVLYDENKDVDNDMVNAKFQFPKVPGPGEVKKPGAEGADPKAGKGKAKEAAAGAPTQEPAGKKEGEKKDKSGVVDIPTPKKAKKSKLKPPKIKKASKGPGLQKMGEGAENETSASFEAQLKSSKGGGQKLPMDIRKEMEERFGRSFRNVRIHLDGTAAKLCREIGARAFTNGRDIYFNTGQFDPSSTEGKRLLAHELTHTIQQGAAGKSIQRAPFEPDGAPPQTTARPPQNDDGKEVNEAGDGFMKGHDNYDEDNVNTPVSEMDEDEKEQMNTTSGEASEEVKEVEEAGVNAPTEDRGADALETTTTEQKNIEQKNKEKTEEEEGKEGEEEASQEEKSDAELAEERSAEALARMEELKDPSSFPEFRMPTIEKPVDMDGKELPGDADVDTMVRGLAYLGQAFREQALDLLRYSMVQKRKAFGLDSVIEKQRVDLAHAEELTAKADETSIVHKETSEKSKLAKEESVVREKHTSEVAPTLKGISDSSKKDATSMADDAGGQTQKHKSNMPKDADARKDAEEQGGDMDDMAVGAMTILEAFLFASLSMETYIQDAAFAKQKNEEGQKHIDETDAANQQYDERNSELKAGNEQTKEELTQVEFGPQDMRERAARIDDGGYELYAATVVMETELIDIQANYLRKMKTVRSVEKIQEEEAKAQKEAEQGITFDENQIAIFEMSQMTPEEQEEYVANLPEGKEEELQTALTSLEQYVGPEEDKDKDESWLKKDEGMSNQLLGRDNHQRLDLGVNKALGLENKDPREAEYVPIENERKQRLNKPLDIADKNMVLISYQEKEAIAGNLVTDSLMYDVGNMFTWANAGKMVTSMIDPRMIFSGVAGGLEKIGNGIINFSEHWKEDPLGAVLQAGADIATGIATIATSILGVSIFVNALLLGLTILGWMFPSFITVPSMTWFGTIMTVTGYVALIAGLMSYRLNELMYQRNLHKAASATTAREFLGHSLEMKENVTDGATGLMSVAAGYGGVKMGPKFNGQNMVAKFGTPAQTLKTMQNGWRNVKALPGRVAGTVRAGAGWLVNTGRSGLQWLRQRIKDLFTRKRNKLGGTRNRDGIDLDGDAPRNRGGDGPENFRDGPDQTPDKQPMTREEMVEQRKKVYDENGDLIPEGQGKGKTKFNERGERVLTDEEFSSMKKDIEAQRGPNGEQVTVVKDTDGLELERLKQHDAAAAFDPETGTVYVRENATNLELLHESYHAKQWMQQGGKAGYTNYSNLAREEFVFREIMSNQHLFNPAEIYHAQRTIYYYRFFYKTGGQMKIWPSKGWVPDGDAFWKGVDPESFPKRPGSTTRLGGDGPDQMPHETNGNNNSSVKNDGPDATTTNKTDGGPGVVTITGLEPPVPRIKKVKVQFKRNPKHSKAEFERQLKGQQDGLNNLTVEEWVNNRKAYQEHGRSKAGTKAQRDYRSQAKQDKIDDYMDQGHSYNDAKRLAENDMKGTAALHDPDQIAGGHGHNITGLGSSRVNSSLGSQWKNYIDAVQRQIDAIVSGMSPEQLRTTKMNFELTYIDR